MISFACPACNKQLKVKDELAGKKAKCPGCGKPVMIPENLATARSEPGKRSPVPGSAADAGRTLPPRAAALPPAGTDVRTLGSTRHADASAGETVTGVPNKSPGDHPAELTAFLAPAQAPDEIGRLGPYRVLAVLGHGGMGVVFRAEDPGLRRLVALKAMLPSLASNEANRKRFIREAQAAAAVKDDHVVSIHQVGEDRGAPFLAMEFLEGEPLDVRLKRGPKLTVTEIIRIGRETALGLAAAHERGLIHRDIKPGNLWLEARLSPLAPRGRGVGGEGFRVKILDFGLARALADNTHLTQTGAIVGTPAYMAPEQAGGRDVDHRCDLFSLGCVLYHACTGETAFKGRDTLAIISAPALETPKAPRQINPAVPEPLSNLVMHLLAKNPEDRPQSALEVAAELAALAEENTAKPLKPKKSMQPPPPSGTTKLLPRQKEKPHKAASRKNRHPLVLAGIAAAALIFLAGALVLFWPTPKGTVRIEIIDPDITVAIDKGDFKIRGADKQDITLAAGEHGLRIQRGDFVFETTKFILTKGERVTLKIELLDGKVQVVQDGKVVGQKPMPVRPEMADWKPLLNGKDLTGWTNTKGQPAGWKMVGDVLEIVPGQGNIMTTQSFGPDFELHAEFNIPLYADKRGQARGNSGIFLLGRYEIQILDSHESPQEPVKACAALYGKIGPSRNVCKPPNEWQTFDITFQAPRLDSTQKVIQKGQLSVVHNGVLVIDKGQFDSATGFSHLTDVASTGPIMLQEHGSMIRFRNLKIKELRGDWPAQNTPSKELPSDKGFVPLFNGKDLTGWDKIGAGDWAVEGNVLRTRSDPGRGWLATEHDYEDFDLELEYRLGPKGNSGVFVHAWKEGDASGGQFIEIQLIDDEGNNTVGKLNGTAAIFGVVAPKPTVKTIPDTWHKVGITSRGRRLTVVFDGQQVVDANLDDYPGSFTRFPGLKKTTGRIGLQHFGTPVEFRNIRLRK